MRKKIIIACCIALFALVGNSWGSTVNNSWIPTLFSSSFHLFKTKKTAPTPASNSSEEAIDEMDIEAINNLIEAQFSEAPHASSVGLIDNLIRILSNLKKTSTLHQQIDFKNLKKYTRYIEKKLEEVKKRIPAIDIKTLSAIDKIKSSVWFYGNSTLKLEKIKNLENELSSNRNIIINFNDKLTFFDIPMNNQENIISYLNILIDNCERYKNFLGDVIDVQKFKLKISTGKKKLVEFIRTFVEFIRPLNNSIINSSLKTELLQSLNELSQLDPTKKGTFNYADPLSHNQSILSKAITTLSGIKKSMESSSSVPAATDEKSPPILEDIAKAAAKINQPSVTTLTKIEDFLKILNESSTHGPTTIHVSFNEFQNAMTAYAAAILNLNQSRLNALKLKGEDADITALSTNINHDPTHLLELNQKNKVDKEIETIKTQIESYYTENTPEKIFNISEISIKAQKDIIDAIGTLIQNITIFKNYIIDKNDGGVHIRYRFGMTNYLKALAEALENFRTPEPLEKPKTKIIQLLQSFSPPEPITHEALESFINAIKDALKEFNSAHATHTKPSGEHPPLWKTTEDKIIAIENAFLHKEAQEKAKSHAKLERAKKEEEDDHFLDKWQETQNLFEYLEETLTGKQDKRWLIVQTFVQIMVDYLIETIDQQNENRTSYPKTFWTPLIEKAKDEPNQQLTYDPNFLTFSASELHALLKIVKGVIDNQTDITDENNEIDTEIKTIYKNLENQTENKNSKSGLKEKTIKIQSAFQQLKNLKNKMLVSLLSTTSLEAYNKRKQIDERSPGVEIKKTEVHLYLSEFSMDERYHFVKAFFKATDGAFDDKKIINFYTQAWNECHPDEQPITTIKTKIKEEQSVLEEKNTDADANTDADSNTPPSDDIFDNLPIQGNLLNFLKVRIGNDKNNEKWLVLQTFLQIMIDYLVETINCQCLGYNSPKTFWTPLVKPQLSQSGFRITYDKNFVMFSTEELSRILKMINDILQNKKITLELDEKIKQEIKNTYEGLKLTRDSGLGGTNTKLEEGYIRKRSLIKSLLTLAPLPEIIISAFSTTGMSAYKNRQWWRNTITSNKYDQINGQFYLNEFSMKKRYYFVEEFFNTINRNTLMQNEAIVKFFQDAMDKCDRDSNLKMKTYSAAFANIISTNSSAEGFLNTIYKHSTPETNFNDPAFQTEMERLKNAAAGELTKMYASSKITKLDLNKDQAIQKLQKDLDKEDSSDTSPDKITAKEDLKTLFDKNDATPDFTKKEFKAAQINAQWDTILQSDKTKEDQLKEALELLVQKYNNIAKSIKEAKSLAKERDDLYKKLLKGIKKEEPKDKKRDIWIQNIHAQLNNIHDERIQPIILENIEGQGREYFDDDQKCNNMTNNILASITRINPQLSIKVRTALLIKNSTGLEGLNDLINAITAHSNDPRLLDAAQTKPSTPPLSPADQVTQTLELMKQMQQLQNPQPQTPSPYGNQQPTPEALALEKLTQQAKEQQAEINHLKGKRSRTYLDQDQNHNDIDSPFRPQQQNRPFNTNDDVVYIDQTNNKRYYQNRQGNTYYVDGFGQRVFAPLPQQQQSQFPAPQIPPMVPNMYNNSYGPSLPQQPYNPYAPIAPTPYPALPYAAPQPAPAPYPTLPPPQPYNPYVQPLIPLPAAPTGASQQAPAPVVVNVNNGKTSVTADDDNQDNNPHNPNVTHSSRTSQESDAVKVAKLQLEAEKIKLQEQQLATKTTAAQHSAAANSPAYPSTDGVTTLTALTNPHTEANQTLTTDFNSFLGAVESDFTPEPAPLLPIPTPPPPAIINTPPPLPIVIEDDTASLTLLPSPLPSPAPPVDTAPLTPLLPYSYDDESSFNRNSASDFHPLPQQSQPQWTVMLQPHLNAANQAISTATQTAASSQNLIQSLKGTTPQEMAPPALSQSYQQPSTQQYYNPPSLPMNDPMMVNQWQDQTSSLSIPQDQLHYTGLTHNEIAAAQSTPLPNLPASQPAIIEAPQMPSLPIATPTPVANPITATPAISIDPPHTSILNQTVMPFEAHPELPHYNPPVQSYDPPVKSTEISLHTAESKADVSPHENLPDFPSYTPPEASVEHAASTTHSNEAANSPIETHTPSPAATSEPETKSAPSTPSSPVVEHLLVSPLPAQSTPTATANAAPSSTPLTPAQ